MNTIASKRHERGWTQRELAEQAGIGVRSVIFAENDQPVGRHVALALAEVLPLSETEVAWLVGFRPRQTEEP